MIYSMFKDNQELEALANQQREYQFDPSGSTIRKRTLGRYAYLFGLPSKYFFKLIEDLLNTTEQTVFVDFGCGDGLALRQFLLLAKSLGKRGQARALGVDLLEPNEDALKFHRKLSAEDLRPEVLHADIDTVNLLTVADLTTLCNTLLWTKNPLQALANAIVQTREGGLIGADWLERIKDSQTKPIFTTQFYRQGKCEIPGFEVLNIVKSPVSRLVLRKTTDIQNSEELFSRWFGVTPKLQTRAYSGPQRGFHFFYSL